MVTAEILAQLQEAKAIQRTEASNLQQPPSDINEKLTNETELTE